MVRQQANNPAAPVQHSHAVSRSGFELEVLPAFVAGFIIGLLLAGFVPAWSAWLFLTIALGGAALSLLVPIRGPEAWLPLLGCAIACGAYAGTARMELPPDTAALAAFSGASGRLTGVCSGDFRPLARGGLAFSIDDPVFETASQEIALSCRIRVESRRTGILPEPGQRYTATGTFMAGDGNRRPARFKAPEITEASGSGRIGPSIGYLQQQTRDAITRLLPERHQGFMQGLLLGDTSRLSRDDRRMFRDTGVSHLLAISGQHLLVLALVLTAMLRWSGIPPVSRALLTVVVLIGYAMMTSGQPSVWRAVAMYIAVTIAAFLEADPGPVRPLAAAALAVLFWNPVWVHHVGFQLSFLAVLGIVLGRPPLEFLFQRFRLPKLLARYLAVSTAASLATMPLAAWHFGMVPLMAFIVNPLVVWSFDFILPIGMLIVILNGVWFKAAMFLAAGLALALDGFMAAIELGAAFPIFLIDVGSIPATVVALFYASMLGLLAWWQQAGAAPAPLHQPALQPGPASAKPVQQPSSRIASYGLNPLTTDSLLEAIDAQLAIFPKRPLRQQQGTIETVTFPVQGLSPESQNIYYRIDDLTLETLRGHPDRLLEAQVYCMALLGNELLSRLAVRLEPPPTPADIKVKRTVKNRYFALALATEAFFDSPLPGRATRATLAMLIPKSYELHKAGCEMLSRFTKLRDEDSRFAHMEYRQKILDWCRALIDALATEEKRRKPATGKGDPFEPA